MYFCEPEYVAAALGVDIVTAQGFVEAAIQAGEDGFKKTFANKRSEINKKLYEKSGGSPVTDVLWRRFRFNSGSKEKTYCLL